MSGNLGRSDVDASGSGGQRGQDGGENTVSGALGGNAREQGSNEALASVARGVSNLSYEELQTKVQRLLETEDWMSSADKVALALEVLRARQLELDLQQARSNIDSLITRAASSPRTLRAVIPSSAVRGMPVNVPIDLTRARLQLRPTANDPSAMFLSIEIFAFGNQESSTNTPAADS
mmetsp:Transcript_8998/g.19076  ORF Transcript_8998/g.19076 Transcript_8998/m.19076 type:complete len:178 (+) Transcript_8998:150-683(+)